MTTQADDMTTQADDPEDVLPPEELANYYRTRKRAANNCEDGYCGGCPQCLADQGIIED